MSYSQNPRIEYMIPAAGGPSQEVWVDRKRVRVTPHSQDQIIYTDPKSKKSTKLPKKQIQVTIKPVRK